MVAYMQEGQINEELLNLELFIIKLMMIYLKEVKHDDVDKNRSILEAFFTNFEKVNLQLCTKRDNGIYILPMHRAFAFFFTRLMMNNLVDPK